MSRIAVIDNVLPNIDAYRRAVLASPFQSIEIGPDTFHGIALDGTYILPMWIAQRFPQLTPMLSFVRRSPEGQVEPNFIHSDRDMGDWTGILYLNPTPAPCDGTTFWRHTETGGIGKRQNMDDQGVVEANDLRETNKWEPWHTVDAVFNRLLLFPASYFHSRAIAENYGHGDDARLIQVVFGTGQLSLIETRRDQQGIVTGPSEE